MTRCSRTRNKSSLRSDRDSQSGDPTGELPVVRPGVSISGAEVAYEAAGLPPQTAPAIDPETLLPHWTEEPTGQMPAFVREDPTQSVPAIAPPVWREDESDYTLNEESIGQVLRDDAAPEVFNLDVANAMAAGTYANVADTPRQEIKRAERLRQADQKLLKHRATRTAPEKDLVKATVTGVAAAIVVMILFVLGPIPVATLVVVALAAGTAEVFAGFRRVGAQPATLLGILGTVGLAIGAYNRGEAAFGVVSAIFIFGVFLWYLTTPKKFDVLDGLAATLVGYFWIGVLGSFAMLLISPVNYHHRQGLAFLIGAIIVTVANDTGALFVGKAMGRRLLAPNVSEKKTVEGLVGGFALSMIVALVVLPHIHPWKASAVAIEVVVLGVLVPLGDLFESMVKRTLGLKDMGDVLPGHGGIVDRVDGLLFALPATYYLVHILHLA